MLRKTLVAAAAATLVAVPAAAQAAPGDIDRSFGWPIGFVNDSGGDIATDVVALPNGGAAVLSLDGSLIAYTATGERDASFGIGGRVEVADPDVGRSASALVRDAQGRLLVAVREGGTSSVVRLTPTGAVDTTWGDEGRTVIRYGLYQDHYVHDLALTPDGRLLVGGYAQASGRATAALARLTTTGDYDTEFAADGSTTVPGNDRNTAFEAIASDGAGGVYAAGSSQRDALFAHILADGTRDAAFDGDGERTMRLTGGDRLQPVSIAHQGNGLFATVLHDESDRDHPLVLALDAASGATRTSFGADGVAAVPGADEVGAIVPGSGDGLLVAASGVDEDSVWQRSLVARFDATTGALDPRFAGDGVRSLPFDTVQWGTRLTRDDAGRVTVAGQGANRLLTWRVSDVDSDVTPSGGDTPPGGGGGGGGGVAGPQPTTETPPPVVEDVPSQQPPDVTGSAAAHRPAAWFHRVRSALRLKGEADQGAARVQVSITRRDGRRCRAVTSTRRARLGSAGACTSTRARWLTAKNTPRAGRTQLWSLRLAKRPPAGRYVATVRALDQEGLAGRAGEVSFRVR